MVCSILALTILAGQEVREFVFTADKKYESVAIAGSFNNWDKLANPFKPDPDGRTWRVQIKIPVGKHGYKFVLDGETWITDPKSQRDENDGNGNINSILVVFPADYSKPGKSGDNVFTLSALKHVQEVPHLNFDRGKLRFTLKVRSGDIGSVNLTHGRRSSPMSYVLGDEFTSIFKVEIPWDGLTSFEYGFELEPKSAKRFFGPSGLTSTLEKNTFRLDAKRFRAFRVPNWVEDTVFYQIFPDRFENGNRDNDPNGIAAWNVPPKSSNDYGGGDLEGVSRRLAHLSQLGVNGVYFNPIFRSPKAHRYETSDYFEVDPILGSNADFAKLSRSLNKLGIRVVLDGVFNHVAPDFPQFVEVLEKQQKSRNQKWFYIKKWPVFVGDPVPYEAWNNFYWMPKVNVDYPPAREYMLSVIDFWERNAVVDGWRLDVAGEVSQDFWRQFRSRLKRHGQDKWIVGEVWGDGSPWLKGDQWDSVMNYPFREAAVQFVASGSTTPKQLGERLMANYESYAPQVSRNLLNLLSSHDTHRFMTLCGNNSKLANLGATLLMTWVGSPSIYYGDEIGMEGGRDPDNRRGMEWNKAVRGNAVLDHYRDLIRVRKSSAALRRGTPNVIFTSEASRTFAFWRSYGQEAVFVAINRSEYPQTVEASLGKGPRTLLGQPEIEQKPDGKSRVTVPALGSVIVRRGS